MKVNVFYKKWNGWESNPHLVAFLRPSDSVAVPNILQLLRELRKSGCRPSIRAVDNYPIRRNERFRYYDKSS